MTLQKGLSCITKNIQNHVKMSIYQPRSTWLWKTCFHRKAYFHIVLFLEWTGMIQTPFWPLSHPDSKEACDWGGKQEEVLLQAWRWSEPWNPTDTPKQGKKTTFTEVCDWRNPYSYSLSTNTRSGLILTETRVFYPSRLPRKGFLPFLISVDTAILLSLKQCCFVCRS